MKHVKLYENFEIELTNKGDILLLNSFNSLVKQKLVPLGFKYLEHKYDFCSLYANKAGTRATYVEIQIFCDSLGKDLYITLVTGIGGFEKIYPDASTTTIKNVVDKAAYLSNLMIKNFAKIWDGDGDEAIKQQEKFKQIIIKDGFKGFE